jgi:hypothetical protein
MAAADLSHFHAHTCVYENVTNPLQPLYENSES